MESPLDILSRAAGMVSSSPAPTAAIAVVPQAVPVTQSPSDMRLIKRKLEDNAPHPPEPRGEEGGGCSSRILKKALIHHHHAIIDTHVPARGLVEDDQPLDMTCKKKRPRSTSPDPPILNSRTATSNSHNNPTERPFYGNGGPPPTNKWNSRSNGVDAPINPPLSSAKLFLENNNSTSDGSGTDHARRPSVIYYATQTPELPASTLPSSGGGGGSGGKFRRRFRHPSNSSTSSESDAAPLVRRKLVKRKRKRPSALAPLTPALIEATRPLERDESGCKSRRVVVITSKEDDIDEHFRRSLGDRYDEAKCFLNASKNGNPVPLVVAPEEKLIDAPAPESKEINLTDQPLSVDDHFAKALGTETWSRIISSKPPSIPLNKSPPPYESKKEPDTKAKGNGTPTDGKS